eukprot:UN10139
MNFDSNYEMILTHHHGIYLGGLNDKIDGVHFGDMEIINNIYFR